MAPHHPEIISKPHHKHLFAENTENVANSNAPTFFEALQEIVISLSRRK